ncbi:MAG: hypothetical protein L6Q99_20195 [Planctomycetes bacterium]|nr:hypothetical protein [Planctomycetota bacterium]
MSGRYELRITADACPQPPASREAVANVHVISIDGAWGAPGLNLSHWPGNRTPEALRHPLSTGSVLAFAKLPEAERARLVGDARIVVNNHYDTDGMLALFAFLRPEVALRHERALLAGAAAGDFFEAPNDDAVALDAVIGAFADTERSPLAARFAGLGAYPRFELAAHAVLERLPEWLERGLARERELWQPAIEGLARGRAELSRATRDELVHLDWTVWTSTDALGPFDPGRHALFGSTGADRVLTLGPRRDGTLARFLIGTRSWFDGTRETRLPRPDLAELAQRLNELERTSAADSGAWRCHETSSPSPELWFGNEGLGLFEEHNRELAPSSLAPAAIRREVGNALRRALALPQ